eukprot:445038_1
MGTNQSSGFGVLNSTGFPLTIGLSMGGTHYYENKVKNGEIFYRRPGAVYYTVFAYDSHPSRRITKGQCAKEIASVAVPLALGVIGTAVTAGVGIAGCLSAASNAAVATVETVEIGASTVVATSAVNTAKTVSLGAKITKTAITTSISVLSTPATTVASYRQFKTKHFMKPLYGETKGCYGGGRGTWIEVTYQEDEELLDPRWLKFEKKTSKEIIGKGTFTDESYPKYYTKQQKEGK